MVVVPVAIPVTVPSAATVPAAGFVLLHTPPPVASLNVVEPGRHMPGVPDIAAGVVGNGFTVITAVVAVLPQLLVSV